MKNTIICCAISLVAAATLAACNDDDVTIYQTPIVDKVETGDVDVTATTATVHGFVSDLSSQNKDVPPYTVGAVYSTSADPTVSGTRQTGTVDEQGNITATITGLEDGVTYTYATFVTLQNRVTYYGEVKSFITTDAMVATADAASVNSVSASLGGTLNGLGDMLEAGSLAHGIRIAATPDGVADGVVLASESTSNAFSVAAEGLVPSTTYYYAAFATVNGRDQLGEVKEFTTEATTAPADQEMSDFVNMGTGKEWARYNVGADTEGRRGALFGYGDLTGLNRSEQLADYASGDISGTDADVAKAANMGSLPTVEDFKALIAGTTREVKTVDGVTGVEFTSTANGNTLFFPLDGVRNGDEISEQDLLGSYMAGAVNPVNADYNYVMRLDNNGQAEVTTAPRSVGASVRSVREVFSYPTVEAAIDNSKLSFGDLEGNGNLRITLTSEWSNGVNAVKLEDFKFGHFVVAKFRLRGVQLKDGAKGSYLARIGIAANGWAVQYWDFDENGKYNAHVTGDGVYTVGFYTDVPVTSTVICTIDVQGMAAEIADMDAVKAELISVTFDPTEFDTSVPGEELTIDNSKLSAGDLENNGNYRITLSSEWSGGVNAIDLASLKFKKTLLATFRLTGVQYKEGAKGSYIARLGFSGNNWGVQNWDFTLNEGTAIVEGDGLYTVAFQSSQEVTATTIAAIDIQGMAADVADIDAVKAELVSVQLDPEAVTQMLPVGYEYNYGDLEGNGNLRLELTSSWGNKFYSDATYGEGTFGVEFTITGLDGNWIASPAPCVADLGFACGGWDPSNWAGGAGNVTITGDGTYTVQSRTPRGGTGFEAFMVDIKPLLANVVDKEKVKMTVNKVYVPFK